MIKKINFKIVFFIALTVLLICFALVANLSIDRVAELESKIAELSISNGNELEQLSNDIIQLSKKVNENELYKDTVIEKLDERIQNLKDENHDLNSKYIDISEEVNTINFDKSAEVKSLIIEWLDIMFRESVPNEHDMERIETVMGISDRFYFEWYPAFITTGDTMQRMVKQIFNPDQLVIVERTSTNNPYYHVWDLTGNNFGVIYSEGSIYSIWIYSEVCDNYVTDFIGTIESGDLDKLVEFVYYEAYGTSLEEQVGYVTRNIVDKLPGGGIKAELIGIDNCFIYRLTDKHNNELYIEVNSDGETFTHLKPIGKDIEPLSY